MKYRSAIIAEHFVEILGRLPGYEPRTGQVQMAAQVFAALESATSTLIEAGAGSGKSLAYLLPLLEIPGPFVISTATIALQEQLLQKDIPMLQNFSKRRISVTLAKGRNHYLCRQKLWELDRLVSANDPLRPALDEIIEIVHLWDGDNSTLPFQPDTALWAEIGQTAEDCLGTQCEFYQVNPSFLATERLNTSHLIITNHALYLTDLATGGHLLPAHRAVIFDEAHQLPAVATRAFSFSIGRYSGQALLNKLRRRVAPLPEEITFGIIALEARLFRWLLRIADDNSNLVATLEDRVVFRLYPDADFIDIAESLGEKLEQLRNWLAPTLDHGGLLRPEFATKAASHCERLLLQLSHLIWQWHYFAREAAMVGERVNWVEIDRMAGSFALKSALLKVGPILQETLWSRRTAILTSATLAVSGDFSYFREQIGLSQAAELVLPSPFNYEHQVILYIPRFLPEPNHPGFAEDSRVVIRNILDYSQGRAFVLFTSLRAMRAAFRVLSGTLSFPCRQQGEAPRMKLLEWFQHTPQAVLFATASFWEGIDVPGEALSCVIIDRLPFSTPDDPVVQARIERLKAEGRDWFSTYTLPAAIIRLKQGFGRLIRTGTDRGLVAILDNRLLTKPYGEIILRALPDCPHLRDL
ncbi:MAG: ATP-dependent DNA helicase [Cyanobacteria bacterium NC_groundwater_1444_Ag_S-0.65um_54_12]|nr:ATP-dependent DNA helicase [Cyanobacteria bacterium NC_groundwater_1444_Ag_S-0.65um_54_12]